MKPKIWLPVLTLAACMSPLRSAARGQTVPLVGKVTNYIVTAPTGGTVHIFTSPAAKVGTFIMTQLCSTIGGTVLVAGPPGSPMTIAVVPKQGTSSNCVTFDPGVSVGANETFSCVLLGYPYTCMVNGVTENP